MRCTIIDVSDVSETLSPQPSGESGGVCPGHIRSNRREYRAVHSFGDAILLRRIVHGERVECTLRLEVVPELVRQECAIVIRLKALDRNAELSLKEGCPRDVRCVSVRFVLHKRHVEPPGGVVDDRKCV